MHTQGEWRWTGERCRRLLAYQTGGQGVIDVATPYVCRNGESVVLVSEDDAALIAAAPDLLAALHNVRALVVEAAMTGFNSKDGDWAVRLFASQQVTTSAIAKAEGRKALGAPARPESDLHQAARRVCELDWSDNDADAVAAIEALRRAQKAEVR